jgi:hypothetical protein
MLQLHPPENKHGSVYGLQCEYLENPLGIDIKRPQLSWKLATKRHGVKQLAYQVQVSKTEQWDNLVWDSGKVLSDSSVYVTYAGAELESRQNYLWNTGFHFGDWLMPSLTAVHGSPMVGANLTKEVVACSSYAYNTELMAKIAQALGKADDAQRYASLNAKIREAFAAEYVAADGKLPFHYQGMYVLALKMKMVPEAQRRQRFHRTAAPPSTCLGLICRLSLRLTRLFKRGKKWS